MTMQKIERLLAMKKRTIIIAVISIFLLVMVIGISANAFGLSANDIESDARKSQKISEWDVSKSINSKLCAMVFYNDALDAHVFSIYLAHEGFSFGYFFQAGGSSSDVSDGIHEFDYGVNGSAIISMNEHSVTKVEIDNGIDITQIDIDSSKPFAVVIPANSGAVTLYDDNGSIVPITTHE
jgi:hypothetical protein